MGADAEIVAAIDCGTNSTRLLVASPSGTLERLMRITRLGQNVEGSGRLAGEALDRVEAVLEEFKGVMDGYGVSRVRVAATSAVRDASNREEFFAMVERTVGVTPEVLSGREEAALSFAGATAELDPSDGPFLVVDIGGGSTEFAFGTTEVEASVSTDMGCVRMTEAFIESDPPLPEELSACLSVVQIHLDDVTREIPQAAEAATLVGLAGTVSAAAAVEIGLADYDREQIHHFVLARDAVEDVFRTLATESFDDRCHNPGLERGRAEVIVGGMCVLAQILRTLGYDEVLVSEADILDGMAASLLSAS